MDKEALKEMVREILKEELTFKVEFDTDFYVRRTRSYTVEVILGDEKITSFTFDADVT